VDGQARLVRIGDYGWGDAVVLLAGEWSCLLWRFGRDLAELLTCTAIVFWSDLEYNLALWRSVQTRGAQCWGRRVSQCRVSAGEKMGGEAGVS